MNCNEREGKAPSLSEDANDDIDDNAGDDEEEDDDDYGDDDSTDNQDAGSDEPHALQVIVDVAFEKNSVVLFLNHA